MASFSGGPKTGHKMKLYYNTGTYAVPVWNLIAEIGDVSMPDFSRMTAELKRRASGYTKALGNLLSLLAIEFRMIHGLDSATFTALRTLFIGRSVHEFLIANGLVATIGTQGLRAPFHIEAFPWDQPLEDISGHDVRIVAAHGGMHDIQVLTITGSPTGGAFSITLDRGGVQGTGNIAHNASNASVQAAIQGLSNVGAGNVQVSGGPLPSSAITIEFAFEENLNNVGFFNNLTGGSSPGIAVTSQQPGSSSEDPAWLVVT